MIISGISESTEKSLKKRENYRWEKSGKEFEDYNLSVKRVDGSPLQGATLDS